MAGVMTKQCPPDANTMATGHLKAFAIIRRIQCTAIIYRETLSWSGFTASKIATQ
jgi:hypothetical protein